MPNATAATTAQLLVEAVAESLMTMGFVDAFPVNAAPADAPADPLAVRVPFAGPRRGALEIVTTESLGLTLAANILGVTPDDPDAAQRGRDALKELANVTCGLFLSRLPGPAKPAMSIPHVREASPARWHAVARRPDAAFLDAEGLPLVVRIRGAE
jgi:hypothetical protein